MPDKPLILIMGPTASGKSALALEISGKISAEIISADSMQAYRGLDIGTAKPSHDEKARIPHHLIDFLDISEPLSVFRYLELAKTAVCEIRSRAKIPLVVGGTGLYLRSLIYGLDPLPADNELRDRLDKLYAGDEGAEKLRELMRTRDPLAFEKWHANHRRLLRALEVLELSGQSLVELQKTWKCKPESPVISLFLVWDRKLLRERIAERTRRMLENGWIDEARDMIAKGLLKTPTAWQALGYSTIGDFLDGKISRKDMEEKISTATWQLARRQDTWFRNKHPEAQWIYMPADTEELSGNLIEKLSEWKS